MSTEAGLPLKKQKLQNNCRIKVSLPYDFMLKLIYGEQSHPAPGSQAVTKSGYDTPTATGDQAVADE